MKKVCAMLCLLLSASLSFAQDTSHLVRWQNIVGVITSQNVDNPVSTHIHSGTFPWSVRKGFASVNLATGATIFQVEALNINGAAFSGTPGPIPAVTGTLVCNAGSDTEVALNTAAAKLDAQGSTQFAGHIMNIPATCSNPLFLLRIAGLTGANAGGNGRWIATGTQRSISE
jgi:hypothetical protein